MNPSPVVLAMEGGAFRLEPLRMEHAPDLWTAGADDEVWTYLMEHPRSEADMRGLVARAPRPSPCP